MKGSDPFGTSRGGWSLAGPSVPPEAADTDAADATDGPDRYVREALVGEGGMGRVYLALDRRLGRYVALKEAVAPGPAAEALDREARLAAALEHPGVVAVHDIGRTSDGRPFYAMHLVRGRSLAERLAGASPEERRSLLAAFRDACHAVGYAHAQGVVHRDLKPANVLVGEFGETRVVDWGLAIRLGEAAPGVAVGTPAWLPPEQARGEAADARTDVWALGAILYHLLAGRPPYPETDDALARAREGRQPPLADLVPDAPAELRAIATKAMAHDPRDRYPDAHALAADVDRYLVGDRVDAHAYTPRELLVRTVRAWRAPIAVAGIAAGIGAVLAVAVGLRLAAEADRARAAEFAAEAALHASLAARARSEAHDGRFGLAGVVGAEGLALDEHPEARGAFVAAWSQRPVHLVATVPLGDCPTVVLDPEGAVCTDGRALWRIVDGAERWRADAAVVDVAVAGGVLGVNLARGAQLRDLATGRVRAEADRLSPLPLAADTRGRFANRRWEGASWSGSLVDARDRRVHTGCDGHGQPREAALHPTRPTHAAACADGTVAVTDGDAAPWVVPAALPPAQHGDVVAAAFAPVGDRLALGTLGGTLALVDLGDRSLTRRGGARRPGVIDLAWSPDGAWLAVRVEGGLVEVWSAEAAAPIASLPLAEARAVGWTTDGLLRVVQAGSERRWRVDPSPWLPVVAESLGVSGVDVAPDGTTWLTAHAEGLVVVRDRTGGSVRRRLVAGPGTVMSATFVDDGHAVVASTAEEAGFLRHDLGTGTTLDVRPTPARYRAVVPLGDVTLGLAFEAGVDRFASDGGFTKVPCPLKEWRSAARGQVGALLVGVDGEVRRTGPDGCGPEVPGVRARRVALGPGDAWLAAADATSLARHGLDGTVAWRVPLATPPLEVAVSPDGRWIAVAGFDPTVHVVRAEDGAHVATLRGHTQRVSTVAFTPDGAWLVSGSWDGTARWWSVDALTLPDARGALAARGWPVAAAPLLTGAP